MAFVFLVSAAIGSQAGQGMSPDRWMAAGASIAGAVVVVLLAHGPAALFAPRRKKN